jgi:hypothetical protein
MSTPEVIVPARLDALLGGVVPDTDAEARLQGLALELRSGAPEASEALRSRVRALTIPRPKRRVVVSRRRLALVLATLVLALVAGSVILGRSGGKPALRNESLRHVPAGSAYPDVTQSVAGAALLKPRLASPIAQGSASATARARHIDMWIELRLRDADRLSAAANDAMHITRELNGFVASSTVGTRGNEGRAEITIRLPVGKVNDALFRLSQLGAITSQRVVTEDRQAEINRASQRIETLRRAIRIAELRLDSGTLSAKERLDVEIRLERLRSQLASVRKTNARLVSDAATADLRLVLHTEAAAGGTARKSGLGGIVGDALHVLGRVGQVALFAAIVLSPLALLALLVWLVRRRRLRLQEAALLDKTRPGAPSPQPPRG